MSEPVRICPYPFGRMSTSMTGFVPCCQDWLNKSYRFMDVEQEDQWNSPQAKELRKRILKGDYSLCKRDLCQSKLATLEELKQNPRFFAEAPISDNNLKAMERGETHLPDGPSRVCINSDFRCNLKCPACRPDYITDLTKERESRLIQVEHFLERHRDSIRSLKLAENGEVLFSPWMRERLKEATPERYPNLESITLLSNGQLFSPETIKSLEPGTQYVKHVAISVDACTEATYKKLRGGNWNMLLKNLEWIGEERAKERFKIFSMALVTLKSNFEEIPDFIKLSKKLHTDYVLILPPFDRGSMDSNLFIEEAVHRPTHPLYSRLMEVCAPFRDDPQVKLGF